MKKVLIMAVCIAIAILTALPPQTWGAAIAVNGNWGIDTGIRDSISL